MAYRFRKKSYRKRSLRSRRFYRSRRYGRYSKRKYFRSRRRSKVEYKRVEFGLADDLEPKNDTLTVNNVSTTGIVGDLLVVHALGSNSTNAFNRAISQGNGSSQRIGAKINPVKLRCWGTFTFIPGSPTDQVPAPDLCIPTSAALRIIIYQVRNGNPAYGYNTSEFTSVNPIFDNSTGLADMELSKRLFASGFGKMGTKTTGGTTYTFQIYPSSEIPNYLSMVRSPYRNGIGSSLKILKDKVYTFNTGHRTIVPFRFKCKKPNRLVWPEDPEMANANTNVARNPIYFTYWFFPGNAETTVLGRLLMDVNYQMFYTDC